MHAGEYLDESRQWTLQFLIALTPKYPTARGSGLWVVFPDAGEVRVFFPPPINLNLNPSGFSDRTR
jgi:hypothetical protein